MASSSDKSLQFGSRGLGFQLLGLTIGAATILGILLTAQGYFAAASALRQQAATSLTAAGKGTVDSIDGWNESRLRELRSLSAAKVLARIAEQGVEKSKKEDLDIALELMKSLANSSPEIE